MNDRYILVGQTPVPCESLMEWAEWFEHADRHVGQTYCWGNLCLVSTVFLGLDHNHMRIFNGVGKPLLFETMTFWAPGGYNSHQSRCSTWAQAEKLHEATVRICRRWGALIFVWDAIQEWTGEVWRGLEYWGERQEKLQRGIPLNDTEQLTADMMRMRWRWRRGYWKAALKSLWQNEGAR